MNIAFLFDSDHKTLGRYYGPPVMEMILASGVLELTQRDMRTSIGDILTYMAVSASADRTNAHLESLCRAVYTPIKFHRLDEKKLEATYTTSTVYCWLFQNMTLETAEALHTCLSSESAYLGAMDVDFSQPLHLRFFRNELIEAYRFRGSACTVFYDIGVNEDPDVVIDELLTKHGFRVHYENQGARRTIFDKYDSIAHFVRVDAFIRTFAAFPGLTHDQASDLAHSLEELHPKLFDVLSAASRTLERAETEEDLAQAALSGRRLLEQVADYLFPPQEQEWNGRKVGKQQYRNRLWAYLESALIASGNQEQEKLKTFGGEVDRLVDLFNAGLHHKPSRQKVELAFRDLVTWLSSIISINPASARNPYLAYESELRSFLDQATSAARLTR